MQLRSDAMLSELRPEHGMTMTSLRLRDGGPNVLWERPGHRPPTCSRALGPSGTPSIETLHDLLIGGWFEMAPHAGLPGVLDGAPTLLHGEAVRLPWAIEAFSGEYVEGVVDAVRTPLTLRRRVEIDGNRVAVTTSIRNRGHSPVSITHGEHPCFDREVFAGGSLELEARSARVMPALDGDNALLAEGEFEWPVASVRAGGRIDLSTIPARADGGNDRVCIELAEPEVELVSAGGLHLTLHTDPSSHPHLLLWRCYRADGAPSFGLWDVLAIEPMSAARLGIAEAARTDAILRLPPGHDASFRCALSVQRAKRAS